MWEPSQALGKLDEPAFALVVIEVANVVRHPEWWFATPGVGAASIGAEFEASGVVATNADSTISAATTGLVVNEPRIPHNNGPHGQGSCPECS